MRRAAGSTAPMYRNTGDVDEKQTCAEMNNTARERMTSTRTGIRYDTGYWDDVETPPRGDVRSRFDARAGL